MNNNGYLATKPRKIIGYMALHYGMDYLEYAIRSVIDHVTEFHVLYTSRPSHGSRTDAICPDREVDLHAVAHQAAGWKLEWHKGDWLYEHHQRNAIFEYGHDADAIIVVDSDEVYDPELIEQGLRFGFENNCRFVRLPFVHMWRCFQRGFAHDPAYPERMIFPKQFGQTLTPVSKARIWHYGYAQRSEVVRYKIAAHGHKAEFRTDVNWFDDVFMANRQFDCHPVGSQYWTCEDIDLAKLPPILESHPYRHLRLIP